MPPGQEDDAESVTPFQPALPQNQEAFSAFGPGSRSASRSTRWRPDHTGDPCIHARPADDVPGARSDVVAVPRLEVFDARTENEAPVLALACRNPRDHLGALPPRVTERRLAMTELSVPESCASTPAPSGSSTNLPAEDALLRAFRHSPVRRGLHRLVDEVQDVAVGILEPHGLEVSCHVHVALTRRVRQVVVVLERDTS
jgi:hypothetical protein